MNEWLTARSPWSNAYIPESPGAPLPTSKLRALEVSLNSAFITYREMYFEGGVSSVYLWDTEEAGQGREMAFAGVVLLKKSKILFQCIS
jgi:capping protein beta